MRYSNDLAPILPRLAIWFRSCLPSFWLERNASKNILRRANNLDLPLALHFLEVY